MRATSESSVSHSQTIQMEKNKLQQKLGEAQTQISEKVITRIIILKESIKVKFST